MESPDNWADWVYETSCLDCHTGRHCFWRGVLVGGTTLLLLAAIVAWGIAASVRG